VCGVRSSVGAVVALCRHGPVALGGADTSRWRLIAAIAVAAVLLAGLLSLGQSDRYTARADLRFGRTTNADAIIAGGTTDTERSPSGSRDEPRSRVARHGSPSASHGSSLASRPASSRIRSQSKPRASRTWSP
jgi:hypothetical protein